MAINRAAMLAGLAALTCGPGAGLGGAPVPPERRIAASVVATLAAPESQPMHMPTDIAVDHAGRVFVADGANDRIVLFGPDGSFHSAFSRVGDQALSRPVGLTIDPANRLWIADTGHQRILIAGPDGRLVEQIELPGVEGGRTFDVTDIAVTADGKRAYIVDNENHRLTVRDNATGTLAFLGKFGEGLGQFRWPFTVAIAPDGYVYICEAIGARLQRLSPADRWAGQVSRWGVELGQLYRPKGLAVDGNGRLYVTDSTTRTVQVFSPRGIPEGVLTGPDGTILRFAHPMGLAFDAQGRLLVVELRADRVAVVTLPAGFVPATQPARPPSTEGSTR